MDLKEKVDQIQRAEDEVKKLDADLRNKLRDLHKLQQEKIYVKFGDLYNELVKVTPRRQLYVDLFNTDLDADVRALKELVEEYNVNFNIRLEGVNNLTKEKFCYFISFPNFDARADDGTGLLDIMKYKKVTRQQYIATVELDDLKNMYIPINLSYLTSRDSKTLFNVLEKCPLKENLNDINNKDDDESSID